MRAEVVTSFSRAGADLYGRRCVGAWRRYSHVPMVVYVDEPLTLPGVKVRLTSDIPGWSQARAALPRTNPVDVKPTSYRWDARRFAVKTFVWCDAAERLGSCVLTWLDGDTVATNTIPNGFFEGLLGDADVAYLGRAPIHPENGYVGFRIPAALPLLRWCRDAFRCGLFRQWDGWTDCQALAAGVAALNVKARDLTSHLYDGNSHIWAKSPLAQYLRHDKGGKPHAPEMFA